MVVYQEIYMLVSAAGFHNAGYIEGITPIERKIYWSFYEEEQKQREKNSKGANHYDASSPNIPSASNTKDILG